MADILIKDSDWNSLSEDMQSQIANIVSEQFPGINIVPSPEGVAATESESNAADIAAAAGIPLAVGADQSCVDQCNTARDVALPACALMGSPQAIAVCIVVVQIAAAICRSQCAE
jgi:hypothetical protein